MKDKTPPVDPLQIARIGAAPPESDDEFIKRFLTNVRGVNYNFREATARGIEIVAQLNLVPSETVPNSNHLELQVKVLKVVADSKGEIGEEE